MANVDALIVFIAFLQQRIQLAAKRGSCYINMQSRGARNVHRLFKWLRFPHWTGGCVWEYGCSTANIGQHAAQIH